MAWKACFWPSLGFQVTLRTISLLELIMCHYSIKYKFLGFFQPAFLKTRKFYKQIFDELVSLKSSPESN